VISATRDELREGRVASASSGAFDGPDLMTCEAKRLTTPGHGGSLNPEGTSPRHWFAARGSARPSIGSSGRLDAQFVQNSERAASGSLFLFDSGKGIVRGFSFQKVLFAETVEKPGF